MRRIDAYKEAARRSGDSPEEVERKFKKVVLAGGLPPGSFDEIPRGEEEAFIQRQIEIRRSVAALTGFPPFERKMQAIQKKRQERN